MIAARSLVTPGLLLTAGLVIALLPSCGDDGKQATGCSDTDVPKYDISALDGGPQSQAIRAKLHDLAQQGCLTEVGKPP